MLQVPKFRLLESIKYSDRILTTMEVLKLKVDKYKMFRDLDKLGYVCSLGSPMSPPRGYLLISLPEADVTADAPPPQNVAE